MADPASIGLVKDLFPDDTAEPWSDAKIGEYLDAGKTGPEILQAFWEARAAKLSTMIDVSESGSSRSMSRLYDNAMRLAEYWGSRVQSAKDEEDVEEDRRPLRFNRITRV